jgi:hypothetical protein
MRFVATHRDLFGVEPILRVIEVPVATFYGWGRSSVILAGGAVRTPG